MICPNWDPAPMSMNNPCSTASMEHASGQAACNAPTQWWFWILAGALGVGLIAGGKS